MNTIFTIGIFLSVFLSVLLLIKRNKTLSDNILAVLLICLGIHLFSYYLNHLGYWEKYPHLVGITHPFPLLYAPLLYVSVVFSLRTDQHFRWKDLVHFTPFIVTYLCMFPFFFGYSAEQKMVTDSENFDSSYQYFFVASFVIFIISDVVYSVLAYRKIADYQKFINENFAYEDEISLQWLRFLILGFMAIFLLVGIAFVLQFGLEIDFGIKTDFVLYILVVLFIFSIGFLGIRYQGIFTEKAALSQNIVEAKPSEYKKSGLKTPEAELLHSQMLLLMDEKKPFLEPKLTLGQLAELLGTSTNNLSQVINQYEEKNFYDFINGYRVKEFIRQASSSKNKNLNLLGIALDSGFNSKSSFNQVFKKITGETPSNYLKSVISG